MRLLVLSDTHLHRPDWGSFGYHLFERAHEKVETGVDVVLHCGDLAEWDQGKFEEGLSLLRNIPSRHHLWVGGNNDLREPLFQGQVSPTNYPTLFQNIASKYGVTFLDHCPVIIGGVAFVGGYGSHDASLWRPTATTRGQTRDQIIAEADPFHHRYLGCGYLDFFRMCQDQIHRDLLRVTGHPVILATHTVPAPELCLYGVDAETDFDNAWMGWDDEQTPQPLSRTPGLLYHFCGHSHRTKRVERKDCAPLINVGGEDQPLLFEVLP